MSARFTFTFSGINHLISSSDKNQDRDFIMDYLCKSNRLFMSLSELEPIYDMDRKQITKIIYNMLKKGWMRSVNESEQKINDSFTDFSLLNQLTTLSESNSAMLVDMSGLIIAATGFTEVDRNYLAASGTALISINNAAQERNAELCNSSPWLLKMNWGEIKIMTQIVNIGSKKMVLITGGHSDLDNYAFIQLIAMLSRRYVSG